MMKTFPINVRFRLDWLLLTLLLFAHLTLFAQGEDYYTAKVHASGAYWRVKTNAQTYRTTIQFFNAHQELIYQETLTGRYIKLSEQNSRLLDSTLYRLVTNRLLTDQIKSYSLLKPVRRELFKSHPAGSKPSAADTTMAENEQDIQCYVSPRGKLGISFTNPAGKWIYIKLSNEADRTFYEEAVFLTSYSRWLDINDLPGGNYLLTFSSKKRKVAYQLVIQSQTNQMVNYQLQAMGGVSK